MQNIKSFQDVIRHLREISDSKSQKGHRFELLMKRYFETDPVYAEEFDQVWLWSEFPHNGGKKDTGIDLVAREKRTGNYCAIQCKFYAEEYSIQKSDIDSFFTESGKKLYDSRIIVSTTDKWSSNAEEALKDQSKDITRIRLQDLEKSQIDWSSLIDGDFNKIKLKEKHTLRPHQQEAHDNVLRGFANANRGKMIMACGTGKTFTSLKIAESIVEKNGGKGVVLYLVPSISLLSQTLREWNNQTTTPFHTFAVCSDSKVSRDSEDISSVDIGFRATTNVEKIINNYQTINSEEEMIVVFSTYQSIDVIHEAQNQGFPAFDLIIADEAHRTTGVTLAGDEESHFVKIHNNDYIKGYKRLYQTATPKVFGEKTKSKADEKDAVLASMDNKELFGEEFHNLGFGEAVERGLLTDYKVMVLVTDQNYVDYTLADQIKSKNNTLHPKDFSRIVGTWNGLSKRKTHSNEIDGKPMRRAVAFTSTIEKSKQITKMFQSVVSDYMNNSDVKTGVNVEIQHVDGTMNNLERSNKLDWLEEELEDDNTCRILSNARCLTEGVDVPALDSVIFFNPRNSIIDIIQAVGRVMRRADGKDYGYIILPITIEQGADLEYELNNNQEYRVVWQVLQALRSHDERFNAMINQMELNVNKPSAVEIIGHTGEIKEDDGEYKTEDKSDLEEKTEQIVFSFPDLEELQDSIYARIVDKVGEKQYWENWSKDVAEIARRHYDRISLIIRDKQSVEYEAFQNFLNDLRNNLNDSIDEDQAIEMLSQHLITKPVFEALFEEHSFVKSNPVSKAMEEMLELLEKENLEKETQSLNKFYESVKTRASKIDNLEGKQKVIIELYDKFFGTAFKETTERLGIVYTPIEIVDFIINSVNDALVEEFDSSLNDKNVNILDPFTGTGTFIVRLLQSGLIDKENLLYKYTNEIHANEIVLLAYYIASINIEETFHSLAARENIIAEDTYVPFNGIVLTDTFEMAGERTLMSELFGDNSERVNKQNKSPIFVIMGNPPYFAKRDSENDAYSRVSYPKIDARISETYAKYSTAQNKNNLYDSYIRAIRWSTDRIGKRGIIGFVTNGNFIDGLTADGLRKSLYEEFTSIYIFNLRGNARTIGKVRQKEGGGVFGEGSQTPVAITLLIKNPDKSDCCINYYDVGDYLTRDDKLKSVEKQKSFFYMKNDFKKIIPDKYHNWINQRDERFESFLPISDSKDSIFIDRGIGFGSSRDAWVTNYSKPELEKNVKRLIRNYNYEVNNTYDEKQLNNNKNEMNWSDDLKRRWKKKEEIKYDENCFTTILYRPFSKRYLYNSNPLIKRPSKWNVMINPDLGKENIILNFMGGNKGFSVLVTNEITDYQALFNNKSIPLYFFEKDDSLFEGGSIIDNISDTTLNKFREIYSEQVSKEDIFFYVYGILHSLDFRERYENDLKKTMPRVPYVRDFESFSKAGRELADLHLNYETVEPYKDVKVEIKETTNKESLFKVNKMRFGKTKGKTDKSIIRYNDYITVSNIPLRAYDYVVNGRSAIEWIIDQYQVKVDKASGIKNDPNDYSENPRYILDLLKRIITVSLETLDIVESLPTLEELSV